MSGMIPGEFLVKHGEIELNAGRKTVTLSVSNTGDRPIQVGSHSFLRNQSGAEIRPQEGARHAA
jgi:urease beta subunit